jgi:hypothetical protein
MKDKELKLEEDEAAHTLGGVAEGGVDGEELSLLSDKHALLHLMMLVDSL